MLLLAALLAGCTRASKVSRFLERGEGYYKAGDYEQAKIEYLNVLRLDPQNAAAIQRLGLIWYAQGAPLRALPFLGATQKIDSKDLESRTKLALSYAWLGALPEARKEVLAILQQSPGDPEALRLLDDTSRSPEQVKETQRYLEKVPDKSSASYAIAEGGLALRTKDFATAATDFQKAAELDPKSSVPHSVMASLYLVEGKNKEAGDEMKAASELEPPRSTARLKYAEFAVESGDAMGARAVLKTVTDAAPDYIPAWILKAKVDFTEGKYDDALATAQNVLAQDSQNLDARMLECQVWLAQGKVKEALEVMKDLDGTYPNVAAVKYQFALADLQNKDVPAAIGELNQTVAINPNNFEAILLLAELNLRTGDAAAVPETLTGLLAKQPNLLIAKVLLVQAYWALNRLDDAAALIRDQIQIDPTNPQFYLLLGLTLRQQNKAEDARKMFGQGMQLAPGDMRFVYQLADLDLREGHFDAALDRAHEQLAKDPKSAAAQFLVARLFFAQRKWDEAEAAAQKTLEIDPNYSSAYDLLISTYVASQKLDPALAQLQTELSKNPGNLRALTMMAMIYEKQDDFEKARDAYEKVLEGAPDFTPALNNLAFLYSDHLNQLDKAFDYAKKARTLQPNDPAIADTLGWIFYKRGEYQQAFGLLQEAAGRLPGNSDVQDHLGMAAYMMGQTDAARTALTQALAGQLDPSSKAEAQRRLALMESGSSATPISVGELESAVAQHPDDVLAWAHLGAAYDQQQAFAKAADAYNKALALNPRLVTALANLAGLYSGPLHDKQKALDLARKARDLAPDDPAMGALLAEIAYKTGDYQWSYSLLQQVNAGSLASDAQVQEDFAWAAYSLGKTDEAGAAMQHVLTLSPSPGQAGAAKSFLAMAALADNGKDIDAAEPQIQKLLAADPQYVPALMAQAAGEAQHGKAKEAAGIYDGVLQQYPDFAPAQKEMATLYAMDPENRAKAYDLAVSARKTLPDDPGLARLLAELSYERKEYTRAIELLQESSGASPLDARSLYYLGMSYVQVKQPAQARDTLRQALAAGLQDPLAVDAKRTVAGLQKAQ